VDILHKKILILLGGIAGTWFYGLKFLESQSIFTNFVGGFSLILFNIFVIGLIVSFTKLTKLDKKLKDFSNGME